MHLIFVEGRVLSCHTILKGVYDPGSSRTIGLGIRGAWVRYYDKLSRLAFAKSAKMAPCDCLCGGQDARPSQDEPPASLSSSPWPWVPVTSKLENASLVPGESRASKWGCLWPPWSTPLIRAEGSVSSDSGVARAGGPFVSGPDDSGNASAEPWHRAPIPLPLP